MQRSLISHRTADKRIAVRFRCDSHTLKPDLPLRIQLALDPDLVDCGLVRVSLRVDLFLHILCPFTVGFSFLRFLLNMQR